MKGRLTRGEGAGIAAVAYALVLGAHVELPGLVPFALFLLAAAPVAVALTRLAAASRGVARDEDAMARREFAGAVSSGATARGARTSAESEGLRAMRAALARLEGELHALEDQRLTELARVNGGAG